MSRSELALVIGGVLAVVVPATVLHTTALALEHLRTVAALDPKQYGGPADKLVGQIRTSTHACLPAGSW
jgi:hypothetical protein